MISPSLFSQPTDYFLKKYEESEKIFRGKVTQKTGFWSDGKNRIYTINTVSVSESYKGIIGNQFDVITQGGVVGDDFQQISHGVSYPLNEELVFFCSEFEIPNISSKSSSLRTMPNGQFSYHVVNKNNEESRELVSELKKKLNLSDKVIEFSFDNLRITDKSQLSFDVLARTNSINAKFAGGSIFIQYPNSVFGGNIVSSENIIVEKKQVISNSGYTLSLEDKDAETLKVNIDVDCRSGSGLYNLGDEFEPVFRVQIVLQDPSNIGNISMDDISMRGNVNYWSTCNSLLTNGCCLPYDEIIGANEITTETGRVPCVITDYNKVVTAGTGDLLTIIGENFGNDPGVVTFINADTDGMNPNNQIPSISTTCALPPDITWSNTAIQVRVPSIKNSAYPAGSGKFIVRPLTDFEQCTSDKPLDIRYAVANFRDNNDNAVKIFMGDDANMAERRWYVDSDIHSNAVALDAVEKSICDWNNATQVNWSYQGLSSTTNTLASDGESKIFMGTNIQFNGGSVDATAFSVVSGSGRQKNCFDSEIDPELRTRYAYVSEVDIVLRKDLTTLPTPAAGWHYDRSMRPAQNSGLFDFYSVLLHELGHAHMLKHALPDSRIMYPNLEIEQVRRIISNDDADGGMEVLESSAELLNGTGIPNNSDFPACPTFVSTQLNCNLTSVGEFNNIGESVSVFPNPLNGNILNVEMKNSLCENVHVKLYDSLGHTILVKDIYFLNKITIDIPSELPNGFYYLSIWGGEIRVTKKVLVIN